MTFCQNSFIIEEMLYEAVKKTALSSNSVYIPAIPHKERLATLYGIAYHILWKGISKPITNKSVRRKKVENFYGTKTSNIRHAFNVTTKADIAGENTGSLPVYSPVSHKVTDGRNPTGSAVCLFSGRRRLQRFRTAFSGIFPAGNRGCRRDLVFL